MSGYDPERHHRRSIRLQGFNYAGEGAYFVTICTQDRACLFGDVVNQAMCLNDAGRMVRAVRDEIPAYYPGVDVDSFVVMPNHIHGIILIGAVAPACADAAVMVGAGPRACPDPAAAVGAPMAQGQPRGVAPTMSLADVVHRFKTLTTKKYADGVHQSQWRPFAGRLWQRNYYEHVIRDAADLDRSRQYIEQNPARWPEDPDNPLGAAPRGRPGHPAR